MGWQKFGHGLSYAFPSIAASLERRVEQACQGTEKMPSSSLPAPSPCLPPPFPFPFPSSSLLPCLLLILFPSSLLSYLLLLEKRAVFLSVFMLSKWRNCKTALLSSLSKCSHLCLSCWFNGRRDSKGINLS